MFLYVFLREIRGHLRERSGFAAICVGTFVPVLEDHEWALILTNFPGRWSLFIRDPWFLSVKSVRAKRIGGHLC